MYKFGFELNQGMVVERNIGDSPVKLLEKKSSSENEVVFFIRFLNDENIHNIWFDKYVSYLTWKSLKHYKSEML